MSGSWLRIMIIHLSLRRSLIVRKSVLVNSNKLPKHETNTVHSHKKPIRDRLCFRCVHVNLETTLTFLSNFQSTANV